MGKFLEKRNLLKLIQEPRDNLESSLSVKGFESVVKNFPTNKTAGLNGFPGPGSSIKH